MPQPSDAPVSPAADHADAAQANEASQLSTLNGHVNGAEYMVREEVALMLTVELPTGKQIKLQANSTDIVIDVRHFLLNKPESCYFTRYHFECKGIELNDYVELGEYPFIRDAPSGSVVLKMVNELYEESSARAHIIRFRGILVQPPVQASNANTMYYDERADEQAVSVSKGVKSGKSQQQKGGVVADRDEAEGDFDFSLTELTNNTEGDSQGKTVECVRNIQFSAWNPPPGNRRLRGDLLYLVVTTLENHNLHITSAVEGFFVNRSTDTEFDPRPHDAPYDSNTLVDLLKRASPMFNTRFQKLLNRKVTKHPFDGLLPPIAVEPWVARPTAHAYDWNRAEDALLATYGMELGGVPRDWNEEYQGCRDLPMVQLQERVARDRTLYRVYTDFHAAALKGAMAVIEGNIQPMNPVEPKRCYVYAYNNIFYSHINDSRNKFPGGDETAYYQANQELTSVKLFAEANIPKLHVLMQAVIDYRGHRVMAQSIVPGIFHDYTSEHVYGSLDNGKTVLSRPDFHELMAQAAPLLHIAEREAVPETGPKVDLYGSLDIKGMVGSDKRLYLLEMMRVTPRDANFPNYETHAHCCVRPELVKIYCRKEAVDRLSVTLKSQAEAESKEKKTDNKSEAKPDADKVGNEVTTTPEQQQQEQQQKQMAELLKARQAALEKNARESELYYQIFSGIRFNLNAFTNVPLTGTAEQNKQDEADVKALADFLVNTALPSVVSDFDRMLDLPSDGASLTQSLHSRGINVRYLGRLANLVNGKPGLAHIYRLCVQEMIVRSAKHLLQGTMRHARPHEGRLDDTSYLGPAIAMFLSALFGAHAGGQGLSTEQLHAGAAAAAAEDQAKKEARPEETALVQGEFDVTQVVPRASANKKKAKREYFRIVPATLWQHIRNRVSAKYGFALAETMVFTSRDKLCMLRSLCLKVGVVVASKDYAFDTASPFVADDIMDVRPVMKCHAPSVSDASSLINNARIALEQGQFNLSLQYVSDAINICHQTVGPIHSLTITGYQLAAQACFQLGDAEHYVANQQRALLAAEKVLGRDHPDVGHANSVMALYLHSARMPEFAVRHMRRALFLAELIGGPEHPETAASHINLATLYQDSGRLQLALKHLCEAHRINEGTLGDKHMYTGTSHHALAMCFSLLGMFRNAVEHERAAKMIFNDSLGPKHERTLESLQWLNEFSRDAVLIAKGQKPRGHGPGSSLSPFLWVSNQSSTRFRGQVTMADVLQMIEIAARAQGGKDKVQSLQEEYDRIAERTRQAPREEGATSAGSMVPMPSGVQYSGLVSQGGADGNDDAAKKKKNRKKKSGAKRSENDQSGNVQAEEANASD